MHRMTFHVEATNLLPASHNGYGPRYRVVNDADLEVARTEFVTWATHLCELLNASGEDHEPTPQEANDEWDRDDSLRRERYAAEDATVP